MAYEEPAWGFVELQPVTQDGKQTLGGLGATIVDSLTTLWLMDLKEEFARFATKRQLRLSAYLACQAL